MKIDRTVRAMVNKRIDDAYKPKPKVEIKAVDLPNGCDTELGYLMKKGIVKKNTLKTVGDKNAYQ